MVARLPLVVGPQGLPEQLQPGDTLAGGGGGGTPGGATTDVQFNNAGVFGGDPNFTWTTGAGLAIGGANGLNINAVDANVANNPTSALAANISVTYDKLVVTPGFSDIGTLGLTLVTTIGQNNYGGPDAGGAFAFSKTTPIPLNILASYAGSGEHFGQGMQMFCPAMSDAFLFSWNMIFSGGPINGDEGQGFCPESHVFQQNTLSYANIRSVTRTTFSTTATQTITGSQSPQYITVASTTGATIGDWIVFNQNPPTTTNLICAAKITDILHSPERIQVICTISCNTTGMTITPAMVVNVDNPSNFAQDRVLVNMTASSYSTGNAYQNGTGQLTGVGVTWANGMVGGVANNIGALSFDADTCSNTPFSAGYPNDPLTPSNKIGSLISSMRSWYQIVSVNSSTTLTILSNSVAADTSYHGNAPLNSITTRTSTTTFTPTQGSPQIITLSAGSPDFKVGELVIAKNSAVNYISGRVTAYNTGTLQLTINVLNIGTTPTSASSWTVTNGSYQIKPAARILQLNTSNGDMICETTSSVWTVGDQVECVVCPYPDMHGFDYRIAQWTSGGTRRQFMGLFNSGARKFAGGVQIGTNNNSVGTFGQPGSDTFAFDTGVYIDTTNTGIYIETVPNANAAFQINDSAALTSKDAASRILWNTQGGVFSWGKNSSNQGLIGFLATSRFGESAFRAVGSSLTINPYVLPEIEWEGWIRLSGDSTIQQPFIEFGNQGDYSGNRAQILGRTSAGGFFGQNPGLDFATVTGSGVGTALPLFSLGVGVFAPDGSGSPFAGLPAIAASTSNTTNSSSGALVFGTSVWNAAHVATLRAAILAAVPGSGIDDAPVSLHAYFYDARSAPGYNRRVDAFSISETGVLTFGQVDPFVPVLYGVAMDPSKTTAVRTVTWPDLAGGNQVIQPTSTGVPGTSQASGTAGEVRWDTTHIYFCFATGTSAADRWFRASGASSW